MKLKTILVALACLLVGFAGYKFVAKLNCTPMSQGKDIAKLNYELYWASFKGENDNVCSLIHQGADVNHSFQGDDGKSPLYVASSYGDTSKLDLKDKSILPDKAIMDRRLKIVKLLIKHGANVKATTTQGLTPLHMAATKEIAEILIKNGAVVDAKSYTGGGVTPLIKATGRHKSVAEALIDHGANVNLSTSSGETPLLLAVREKNVGVVELLIKRGADINFKNDNSETALEYALQSNNDSMAQLLMNNGAVVSGQSELGLNEIHWAVKHNNLEMVNKILEKGGDVDPVSKDGRTPLVEAVINNNKNIADFLIKHGANVNFSSERNWSNRPVLFFAKDKEMLTLLLNNGASANAIDSNGKDIFYYFQGKPELIEVIKNR